MVDILHVVAIVEHVEELFEQGQVFCAERLALLREEGDFLGFEFDVRKGRENG